MWSNPYTRTRNSLGVGVGKSAIVARGFTFDIDFAAGTAIGGPQSFSGSPGAGSLFRQGGNGVVCYAPNASGTLSAMSSSAFRRTNLGEFQYPSINVRNLWNRDLTNAVWVSGGGGVTVNKNQTGADGSANAATLITASGANATLIQATTNASNNWIAQVDIKRITGTGPVDMTIDGGTTWQTLGTIPGAYDTSNPKVINQSTITNPGIGFRLQTSGDAIAVDFVCLFAQPTNYPALAPVHARPITTSATVQTFIERAYASFPDNSPLSICARGPFAFYWQGRSSRQGGFIMTSASNLFCSVTQGAGAVQLQNGSSGVCKTADGVWKFDSGLTQLNKVAGWCNGTDLRIAANGVLSGAASGTIGLDAALDHWDLGTNGAGNNSIFGITERFKMGPGFTITDADLIAMTT